jgi:hypothetical protein
MAELGPDGWTYNGDPNSPTLSPSLLVRSGHFTTGHKGPDCWCNYMAREGVDPGYRCRRCHTSVTDGRIYFHPDCSHSLAGKNVPIPDFPLTN